MEHGTTLLLLTAAEGEKQRRAAERLKEVADAAAPFPTVPAYEAPDELNTRARGWLKHLWRKSTTKDDWSKDGVPHPWWDRYSGPPMSSFPRFDLQESTYATVLMADRTPAWREVYADIMDGLTER